MIRKTCTVLLFVAFLVATSAAAEGATIGGDIGYYQVNANVAGAEVSFNDDDKGTTGEDGTLTVEVYVTGTPYTSYSVAKEGYETFTAEITQYPAKGETVQLQAELSPLTIGGDKGYYEVVANVDGAEVSFNDDVKGVTGEDGTLTVEVYVTGTPYTSYSVAKEGYETFTAEITQYPAKGETGRARWHCGLRSCSSLPEGIIFIFFFSPVTRRCPCIRRREPSQRTLCLLPLI
jgi:hypothetical protein